MKNLFSNNQDLFIILAIIFFGPFVGLIISIFGLALAPPWTGFSDSIVPLFTCISMPIGLIFLIVRKFNVWLKLGMAFLLIIVPIGILVLLPVIRPKITGMTNCKPLPAQPPQVRYQCESTSSDDADFSYKFILEGWENFPIMHVVEP